MSRMLTLRGLGERGGYTQAEAQAIGLDPDDPTESFGLDDEDGSETKKRACSVWSTAERSTSTYRLPAPIGPAEHLNKECNEIL